MTATHNYHIGTPGKKWTTSEKETWRSQQQIKRSYKEQVLTELDELSELLCNDFELVQYGT